MSKRRKRKRISLSPATTLRPRLDNLWADDALLHKDDAAIERDLDMVARDVVPDLLVETMLRAYLATSPSGRARLDSLLPHWLSKHDHVSRLKEILVAQSLDSDSRAEALAWMGSLGIDTESLVSLPDLFLDAYYYCNVTFRINGSILPFDTCQEGEYEHQRDRDCRSCRCTTSSGTGP